MKFLIIVVLLVPLNVFAQEYLAAGYVEDVYNRSRMSDCVLMLDGEEALIYPDGTFSHEYDGDAVLECTANYCNLITRDISGNYGGGNDSLVVQMFPEGVFEYSLFDIFNNMKFLGLPSGYWGVIQGITSNWGFFEDPEYLAPVWFSPEFNNHYVTSLEYPDSTYSFMEVLRNVFLEPTREDSMFGHHVQDSGYPWHHEVPDSNTSTTTKGVNFYLSYRNHTNRSGNLVIIEIADWNTSLESLLQAAKHEWMAHAVWFNDILAGNPYNPLTICGAGLNYDFSDIDLYVLKVAYNLQNGTEMDWYGEVVGVSPEERTTLIPQWYSISIYPNPANPTTWVTFNLPYPQKATLAVYNLLGQKVATLAQGLQPPGSQTYFWNASNFSSGTYLIRLETDITESVQPIIVVK